MLLNHKIGYFGPLDYQNQSRPQSTLVLSCVAPCHRTMTWLSAYLRGTGPMCHPLHSSSSPLPRPPDLPPCSTTPCCLPSSPRGSPGYPLATTPATPPGSPRAPCCPSTALQSTTNESCESQVESCESAIMLVAAPS